MPDSNRFAVHPWKIIETEFDPDNFRHTEAVMALANGYMGQRASLVEGPQHLESLPGNYVAGVFDSYPNPTMIPLKGRPQNPSEMVNLPDHLPVRIRIGEERVDPTLCDIEQYERTLHMDRGVLTREMTCETPGGRRFRLRTVRFLSLRRRHIAATRIELTPVNFCERMSYESLVDGTVSNVRHEHLGDVESVRTLTGAQGVTCRTLCSEIEVAVLSHQRCNDPRAEVSYRLGDRVSQQWFCPTTLPRQTFCLDRIVAVATSRDCDVDGDPLEAARDFIEDANRCGFDHLLAEQEEAWSELWDRVQISIQPREGGDELTQGLRYCLFQMMQNAPHEDPTLNIGAKGLTGEHYSGTYFWDTEVFMLPMFGFVLPEVARNLVHGRCRMLPGARRKAREMDLEGAAYPWMSDAEGNESCTLWQFSLLGVHVTSAVAWGVWLEWCHSGDLDLVAESGIDVLVETGRFWLSRVFWRDDIRRYVINRVLGPDEYHQGVDNNFYTNIMARENLLRATELAERLREERPDEFLAAADRLQLDAEEIDRFRKVAEKIHLPRDEERDISLQDDRFDRLEPHDLEKNPPGGALNAAWSYDRIMRTQLLRQGDVVVAHILLGHRFTENQIRRDFEFYEPKTTHDSSLSFCHHSIVAARLGKLEMALDYFLRTARLDLDDLHGNTWMGVHTACLAGAWQCVALGFGGLRWYEGELSLDPKLPEQWESYSFSLHWRGTRLNVTVREEEVELETDGGELELELAGRPVTAGSDKRVLPL